MVNDSVEKYDVTFKSYDELYREEQFRKYRYVFLEKGLKIKRVVADIGCGTGLLIEFLKKHSLDHYDKYFCIEPSENMLKMLVEKKILDERIIVIRGYGEYLPIRDHVVDSVFLFTVWDNVEDHVKVLNEALRIVSPRGYVLISMIGKSRSRSPKDLHEGFKPLGHMIDRFYIYE